jgi:hypothetical protein
MHAFPGHKTAACTLQKHATAAAAEMLRCTGRVTGAC